jgi:hypothetical protein
MECPGSSRGSRPGEGIHGEGIHGEGIHGEGVDDGDGDALWQGHEDVTPSLGANGGATSRGASASREAGEWAEGLLKGGGDARPVHSMAQNPFQHDMAQRNLWGGWSIACRGGCPCGGGWLQR